MRSGCEHFQTLKLALLQNYRNRRNLHIVITVIILVILPNIHGGPFIEYVVYKVCFVNPNFKYRK